MKKKNHWVLALSAIGFLDSIWLLILHRSEGLLQRACGTGDRLNCDALYQTEYSEWFGLPAAAFSALFFAWMFAIAIAAWRTKGMEIRTRLESYLALFSSFGLGVALYMAYIATIVLDTFCPYCMVLWVVLALLFAITWKGLKDFNLSDAWKYTWRKKWFWAGLLASAGFLIHTHFDKSDMHGKLSGAKTTIVGEEARSLGPKDAPVTIAIYTDFECPWCRVGSEVLSELHREMPNEVRVVFKFYPLDMSCNPSMKRPMHRHACTAAIAAYCASVEGKFWEYHDDLFRSQKDLSEERLVQFARGRKLSLNAFDACRRDPKSREVVVADVFEGIRLAIRSTPTLFVNGQKYSGPLTVSALRDTVEKLN